MRWVVLVADPAGRAREYFSQISRLVIFEEHQMMLKFVDIGWIAEVTGTNIHTVRKHVFGQRLCQLLRGLPAPIADSRGSRLSWVAEDVLKWVASKRTNVDIPLAPVEEVVSAKLQRPRGRPRKAVRGGGANYG